MFKNILLAFTLIFSAHIAQAQNLEEKLPTPNLNGGKLLMQTINRRHSVRDFAEKDIDKQTLSEILWSAWGISNDGKRTIPTSMNKQNLKVYAIKADGAWRYDAKRNSLIRVSKDDLRPLLAQQDYVYNTPLNLIYVGSDPKNSPLHAGSSYQNVGLYCTSKGLNNVVRGYIDRKGLHKALDLDTNEEVIISQAIGWSK